MLSFKGEDSPTMKKTKETQQQISGQEVEGQKAVKMAGPWGAFPLPPLARAEDSKASKNSSFELGFPGHCEGITHQG